MSIKPSKPSKDARCPTCHRKHRRSLPQNRRYFLLLHAMADKLRPNGEQLSVRSYHLYFKQKFLGYEETKLPNGKTELELKSTTDLEVPEFNEYMEQVEAEAALHNVWLADLEGLAA